MTNSERVTGRDLQRVADLANLELTEEEEASMLRDLNSILDHVAHLNELDTSSVPAMAQVSEILGSNSAGRPLREDEVISSLDRATVMECAPDSDGTFFRVPKVIER
ncbi:Aspartyl-tRNA(Asn) amidotransferase subunit C [Acidisarcina polymorpha]|uniref:Aspartyl/glutamyl-tRNA(Asn/Gln) amidotransferase subunit C n=1 Tax=Acidisarcina polymorpha TaxID=2211140 RepID=A0A2Z5FVJ9_9BACT|nr:Asp-tRNA(Asn)/Glu-tRNA(Gln) amidotransferase subunit GatC [Acidisarcina polymorpha]AXC10919.1 Aspartyl-tRNA(Asn) amidotransferase subunit C [Acidisarcina polymorpha]